MVEEEKRVKKAPSLFCNPAAAYRMGENKFTFGQTSSRNTKISGSPSHKEIAFPQYRHS